MTRRLNGASLQTSWKLQVVRLRSGGRLEGNRRMSGCEQVLNATMSSAGQLFACLAAGKLRVPLPQRPQVRCPLALACREHRGIEQASRQLGGRLIADSGLAHLRSDARARRPDEERQNGAAWPGALCHPSRCLHSNTGAARVDRPQRFDLSVADADIPVMQVDSRVAMARDEPDFFPEVWRRRPRCRCELAVLVR